MKKNQYRVLLIEDNQIDARLIREYLHVAEGVRFTLAHADRLAAGLRHLETESADVILLDLSLPDSHGWETFHHLQNRVPTVPIVILTGLQDETLARKAASNGAQDYLIKGEINGSLLARTLTYAVERQYLLQAQRKLNRALTILSDVNQAVVRAKEEQALLEEVCAILTNSGGYALAWVGFAEPDKRQRVRPVAQAGAGVGYLEEVDIVWADTERGQDPIGKAVRTGRPFIVRDLSHNEAFAPRQKIAAQYGFRSSMALPLRTNGHTFGALKIYAAETAAFDEEEVKLLTELAGDLAYGIDTLRTDFALHQSNQRLMVLREIEQAILSAQSPDTIAHATLTRLQQLIPHQRASVALFDYAAREVTLLAVSEDGPLQKGSRFPIQQYGDITELSQGKYRLIDDLQAHAPLSQTGQMLHDSGLRSLLNVPLISREGMIGVLSLSASAPGAFTATHAEVAQDVTGSLAVALQNAQLFLETEQQAHRLAGLYEIALTINSTLKPEALLTRLGQQLYQLLASDTIAVALYDEVTKVVEVALVLEEGKAPPELQGLRLPLNDAGLSGWVIHNQRALLITDMEKDELPAQPRHGARPARSWLGVPLLIGDRVIGILSVQSFRAHAFDDADRRHLEMIGAQVAIAIHNADLFAQTETLLEQTQAQARQMQQILDTVPEGVLLLDGHHRILSMNPKAEELMRLLTTAQAGDVLTEVGGEPIVAFITLAQPDPSWQEVKATTEDRLIELIAQPIEKDTTVNGWVLALRDVTEARQRQRHFQMQQRLATVGQLAAGIAHDFNNIMAVISLYSDLLTRNPDHERRADYLQTINAQSKHAAKLISQILDFSRRSVMTRSKLDLRPFVKELVKLLQRTLSETIEITFAESAGQYFVEADPTHLQQALMNLAVNARDAMPDGGKLKLRLTHLSLPAEQPTPVPDMACGEWIRLSLTDTGTGIEADIIPHLFEPFFTTKVPGQGTGLGLAQVYGIVKQLDGEITVTSDVGTGTTFTIYLPALSSPTEVVTDDEKTRLRTGSGQTILLVEDNDTTRNAIAEILDSLNYKVLATDNGVSAIQRFAAHSGEIALVVTDMIMPKMSGSELYAQLKAIDRNVKVVIITGYPLEENGQKLLSQGIVAWVQKPFSVERLAEAIHRALKSPG